MRPPPIMTTRTIAIALSKGGVGKTTTAVHLAAGLAAAGHRVLLVDCDTQGQTAPALGVQPEAGLADVLTDHLSVADATMEARPNLFLLAGGRDLAGARRDIDRREFAGEKVLRDQLSTAVGFDFVLLDTAPGWDTLNINALFAATEVLAPVSLEALAVVGVRQFVDHIARVRGHHERLRLRYIVPTFFDRRVRKSEELLAQLRNAFPAEICEPIRYSVRLSEAPGHGQTVFEYAPGSAGAEDYARLVEVVVNGA